ncbi:hypothetical protein LTR10_013259 [Elasticomyces elasticus]|uniref:SAM domain-containing protein n=1 Tax=Exophiala sideris TaxID=1016849 RepID=A0ABR0J4X5_9EURO|nr:hypothetical protein LTR10_013259 [Elasticomyces elasticus]KAK5027512.1 hypothetical protein LTS07_007114 [Exophiala sideris]KAK5034783.1 hypothetical protein LTR13_005965 [Exophiala sideris]KAK5056479.1 hypothetical protein LTR69_008020 [Exophiala sideris]KAK5181029.1 hypothetical protein LTR44_006360 [Eurotiomycetes sp. CCFEE 6388]
MDWSLPYSPSQLRHVEMLQKHSKLAMLSQRTSAPRPLSEATEFDTDNEEDSDSAPRPWSSEGDNDSQSTLSSPDDLPTPPNTGGLGGFEFHFDDKAIVGPQGPHLFRGSPEILTSPEDDVFLTMSPVEEFKTLANEIKPPAKPINALNRAVAELDESQVRDWTPRQVADWMHEAGFERSVVDKFLIHDISGSVLIDLQFEDLKELDISSFGKRHRVMSSIHQLRNSSMITLDTPLSRTPSRTNRSPRALQRVARPDERQVVVTDRSRSRRRGRQPDIVTPAESISIVGIEQVIPKEHKCAKGEDCPKWQKQQRRILRIQQAFDQDTKAQRRLSKAHSEAQSEALPSVVGSSDVLGPSAVKITAESLSSIQPRDAQENIRQFLNFQHLHSPSHATNPSPPPAASASFAAKSANLDNKLGGLPKLTIPGSSGDDERSPSRTPISALQQPTQFQVQLKAQLQGDPYHYGGVASPADIYRIDTPMSATDIPITAMAIDPCQRDISQSVPPEMRYGAGAITLVSPEPIQRCTSTQPLPPPSRRHIRQQSFTPSIPPVQENNESSQQALPSSRPTELELANHQGWMRKRRTTRILRHEWQDNYCTLVGNKLTMHETHYANALPLEKIDVDEYTLHAYAQASSSKLSAAFKKSLLGQGKLPAGEHSFAFSLIPDSEKSRKIFEKGSKTHHFAVDSSKERIEWMRKLMLAKAMKKNDACQI